MDRMREEFESWANSEFDIDCSEMSFGFKGNDKREQYHNDDDPDGAITISAMFYAWKASRAALCVELPQQEKVPAEMSMSWQPFYKMMSSDVIKMLNDAGVSYK